MLITDIECEGRVTRQSTIFELVPETGAEIILKRRHDDNAVSVFPWDLLGKCECACKWQVQTLVALQCVNGSGDYETGISNQCGRRENLDGAISKNVRLREKEDDKFLIFTF